MVFSFVSCDDNASEEQKTSKVEKNWYRFVDDLASEPDGYWQKLEEVKVADSYKLEVVFDGDKTVEFKVNDKKLGTQELGEVFGDKKVSQVFIENRAIGAIKGKEVTIKQDDQIATTWTIPTLNGEKIEVWGNGFDNSGNFLTKDENNIVIENDASKANGNRYQGALGIITSESGTWTVSTTLSFPDGSLDKEGFAPALWVRVGNDNQYGWVILQLGVSSEISQIR